MKYQSTRGCLFGGRRTASFTETVLTGLADDGGLLVPVAVPRVSAQDIEKWKSLDYAELSFSIMRLYIDQEEMSDDDLRGILKESFSSFRRKEVAPISQVGQIYLLELFHGPTYSFKDIALQFLGALLDYILRKRGSRMVILGATSGDTGSAAIASLSGRTSTVCVILYPKGKISRIQELQMTTHNTTNVHCIAINGTFDDCQNIVKECFNSELKQQFNLGAVNSINWARILAQIVYYWYAAFKVLAKEPNETLVDFSVPTGNFGNILAGYYAQCMGAPIGKLVIASNENDILVRFRNTGSYRPTSVKATLSPSMDIQVSSNLERFLFDAMGRNSEALKDKFEELKVKGSFVVGQDVLGRTQDVFAAFKADDTETIDAVKDMYASHGWIMDPHTAVGYVCGLKFREYLRQNSTEGQLKTVNPLVCVATAHFGKFCDAVEPFVNPRSLYEQMPDDLLSLDGLPERHVSMEPTVRCLKAYLHRSFSPSIFDRISSWVGNRPWQSVVTTAIVASAVAAFMLRRRM